MEHLVNTRTLVVSNAFILIIRYCHHFCLCRWNRENPQKGQGHCIHTLWWKLEAVETENWSLEGWLGKTDFDYIEQNLIPTFCAFLGWSAARLYKNSKIQGVKCGTLAGNGLNKIFIVYSV